MATKFVQSFLNLMPVAGFMRGLTPDPLLTVSEWADEFRLLPQVSAEPGKFRMSKTPYMKEIIDHLSVNDPAQEIIFKKAAQIGATESGNNWLGYMIGIAPTSMLYVMPTDSMMKDTSKNRIQKMIDDTPSLKAKIKPSKSKVSNNTIQFKEFEGGFFKGVGANSPVGLASTAVRNVYLDEIDRYPLSVGGEGSAIDLAKTRTSTYGARRKMFLTSTPTMEGTSAIDLAFKKTGQRYYNVPCPHCGVLQVLNFEQLRYDKKAIKTKDFTVVYECPECEQEIPERFKPKMLADGKWIPTVPDNEDGLVFGYHLNALYSPYGWYSWVDMVKDFEDAQNDIPKMITFTNTKLGEVYSDKGEKPDWQVLWSKRELYKMNVPFSSVAFLTAGVDVQADRLEVEIVGWMKGKKSQSIDYRILFGDTAQTDVWKQLDAMLNESWTREDDCVLTIAKMAIDTGYNTTHVYDFCRKHTIHRVIPIKGQARQMIMISHPKAVDVTAKGKAINNVKIFNIAVSLIKSELYGWLKLMPNSDGSETYPDGYCHFPQYDEQHFRSLIAEECKQVTNKKGQISYEWMVKYKRNERLDCRVYARAAAAVVGMDRFNDKYWDELSLSALPALKTPSPIKKKKQSDFWK
ncbi:MAG: phage terminase large subunit family protein [Ferruginibacter sp.]|nr:phage terminase large subunit family protein [Ferruginibacter sp.]